MSEVLCPITRSRGASSVMLVMADVHTREDLTAFTAISRLTWSASRAAVICLQIARAVLFTAWMLLLMIDYRVKNEKG